MFLSHSGCGLDMAYIAKSEGHDVWMVVTNPQGIDVGKGIIEFVSDIKEGLRKKPDFVICDDVYFGSLVQDLRSDGYIVLGGSVDTDSWENSREVGQKIMELAGIKTPESKFFTDYNEALDFLKDKEELYVLKYNGEVGIHKGRTVVPVIKEELEWYLKIFKEEDQGKEVGFELQKMMTGAEVAQEMYFNGEDFVGPLNINFEYKRMFTLDCGGFCGESGTLSTHTNDMKLFNDKGLGRVRDWLKKAKYKGSIDLNCILTDEGDLYGLEWSAREGWPIQQIKMRQYNAPVIERLYDIAKGGDGGDDWLDKNKLWGVGIGFFVQGDPDRIPIFIENEDQSWLGLDDVRKEKEGVYTSLQGSGTQWYKRVIVVVGTGITPEGAQADALKKMKNIHSTYGWYRSDIGMHWWKDRKIVKKYIDLKD